MSAPTNVAPVIIKRKTVKGGDGHHGGAWKVAYADFVTAMMAFFMLMWLLNATTEKQRKGIADYFSPAIPVNRVSGGGDGALSGSSIFAEESLSKDGSGATRKHTTSSDRAQGATGIETDGGKKEAQTIQFSLIENLLTGNSGESTVGDELLQHIITRVTDEGLIIELFAREGRPLFEGDTDLPTRTLRNLALVVVRAAHLVTNDIAVGGHMRSYPVTLAENPVWELSAARADRLRELLERAGEDPERMRRIVGHADRMRSDPDPMSIRNNRLEVILLRH